MIRGLRNAEILVLSPLFNPGAGTWRCRAQTGRGRKWATELGYEYVDEYRDLGVSAFRGKNRSRGDLARFLEDIRSGKVHKGDCLGVESFDRLSREGPLKAFKPFHDIIESGVGLVARGRLYTQAVLEAQPWLLHECLGEMNRAYSESKTKSDRLLKAHENKRQKAREHKAPVGANCPGWLRLSDDGSKYEVIPDRVAIVRRIFEECIAGIGQKRPLSD